MPKYEVKWKPSALREFQSLPVQLKERVRTAAVELAQTPRPQGVVKLSGQDNTYRICIGDYRLVYEIHDRILVILILRLRHRRDVYRD